MRSCALVQKLIHQNELVTQRYPLVFACTMLEAFLAFLHDDAVNALWICALFSATCALVLLDGPLKGWGHPLAHVCLLPGCVVRTLALVVRVSSGGA